MDSTVDWRDLSTVCFGLIAAHRIDATKFASSMFCEPFDKAYDAFFAGANKSKLSKLLGQDLELATNAAAGVSDESAQDVEWHKNLRYACSAYALGKKLERTSKQLVHGELIDTNVAMELAGAFKNIAEPDSLGLVISNTVDLDDYVPIMLSGYPPIDEHVGGIPVAGNIMVMATTGTGKSLWTQQFTGHFLKQYPEKKVAIWSLEMTNQQYLYRGLSLYPLFKEAHEQGRILVSDAITDINTIGLEAASAHVDMIVIDYIDCLIRGEGTEGKYAEIYTQMNNISRSMGIPFVMVLQPNRQSYTTGIPQMYHARYTGGAENGAALFLVLFEPKDESDCSGEYTFVEDSMYMIFHKSRFGWPKAKGPGAVVLPKCKARWSDEPGEWLRKGNVPQSTSRKQRRSE